MPVLDRSQTPVAKIYIQEEIERYPYTFHCPFCVGTLACKSIEDGIVLEQRHTCGEKIMKTPRNVNTFLMNKGGIALMWKAIDDLYDQYRTAVAPDPMIEFYKNKLTGMADMLHIAMRPYFATRDDIVVEVMARGRARDTGEEHTTPGIGWIAISPHDGGTPWEPALGGNGYTSQPEAMIDPPYGFPQELVDQYRMKWQGAEAEAKAKRSAPKRDASEYKPPAHLDAALVATVKQQKAAGFDDKMLMMGHNLKPEDLKWAFAQ